MNGDEHLINLGKLWTNLLSLELSLRFYLVHSEPIEGRNNQDLQWENIQIGDKISVSPATSYDSLSHLIKKYNDKISTVDTEFRIEQDQAIVEIRHCLAHGRMLSRMKSYPLTLFKFGPEEAGQVKLTHKTELSIEWFKTSIKLVYYELKRVGDATLLIPNVQDLYLKHDADSSEPEIREILAKIERIRTSARRAE